MSETQETQEETQETQSSAETQKPEVSDLTPEQWKIAYESPRFKSLNEAKKERDKLAQDAKTREEDEMKRKGELEQLLTQKEQEVKDLNDRYSQQVKTNAILAEAGKQGVIDPDAVVRLTDMTSIETDDNGNPTNVADVVGKLLAEKTYLVGKKQDMGSDTSTSQNSDKPFYKHSELKEKIASDVNWYTKNAAEVEAAFAEGRVDMGS